MDILGKSTSDMLTQRDIAKDRAIQTANARRDALMQDLTAAATPQTLSSGLGNSDTQAGLKLLLGGLEAPGQREAAAARQAMMTEQTDYNRSQDALAQSNTEVSQQHDKDQLAENIRKTTLQDKYNMGNLTLDQTNSVPTRTLQNQEIAANTLKVQEDAEKKAHAEFLDNKRIEYENLIGKRNEQGLYESPYTNYDSLAQAIEKDSSITDPADRRALLGNLQTVWADKYWAAGGAPEQIEQLKFNEGIRDTFAEEETQKVKGLLNQFAQTALGVNTEVLDAITTPNKDDPVNMLKTTEAWGTGNNIGWDAHYAVKRVTQEFPKITQQGMDKLLMVMQEASIFTGRKISDSTLEDTLAKIKRDQDIMKNDPTVKGIKTSLGREKQISTEERAKHLKDMEGKLKRNATARKQGKELPYPEAEEAVTTDPRNVTYSSPGLKKIETDILKALDTKEAEKAAIKAKKAAEEAAAALKLEQQLYDMPNTGLSAFSYAP